MSSLVEKLAKLQRGDQLAIEFNDEVVRSVDDHIIQMFDFYFIFKSSDTLFFRAGEAGPMMGVSLDKIKDVRKIGGVLLKFRAKP